MEIMKKVLRIAGGVVATLLLLVVLALLGTSVSPIYDFRPPQPFRGPDIYNPYREFDTTTPWRRVNIHTHTRVKGMLNECEYWPEEVLERYDAFGYDYIGISNHNEITPHPEGIGPGIYEHGYNVRNFHKLVIGSKSVNRFDALAPFMTSQLQWQLDMLREDGVLLQINHPIRTPILTRERLRMLDGYNIIELTSAKTLIKNEFWDWALSAGHYCYGLFNDDLHFPDNTRRIATRCSFWAMPAINEESIMHTLRTGCFYAMCVPDFGDGDWEVKYARNRALPAVRDIGLRGDTVYMALTERADSIAIYGSDCRTLSMVAGADSLAYRLAAEDSFARFVAYMADDVVIMSNPFARYDAVAADMPGCRAKHTINITYTILYNLALALLVVAVVWLYFRFVVRWKRLR